MGRFKKNKNKTTSPPNEETLIAICKKATNLLEKKKEKDANAEMEKIKYQYKSSAFFHHVNSAVKFALHFRSPDKFLFQESVVSAYFATVHSHTSVDYSSNYVRALLHYGKNYNLATKECLRALSLKDPKVTYGNDMVNFYQEQLQNYMDKCEENHFEINKQLGFKDKELFSTCSTECIEVRETCWLALCFLNRKGYHKAERFIQEESHGFHYAFAAFHATSALVKYYNKRVQESISFARNATLLSQNNVEYSLFYIELLLVSDFSVENFKEAAKECKRSLAVNDLVDSFIDRFGESKVNDEERIFSYRKRIECIMPEITSPHFINITSFKEYCASFPNKAIENLVTMVLSSDSTRKLRFCPKCDEIYFNDSESQMSHLGIEHGYNFPDDKEFPDEFNSLLPKKVDDVWKASMENDSSEPVKLLLKYWNCIAESSLQYIWKYILEEEGNYELTGFLGKFKDVADEKLENIKDLFNVREPRRADQLVSLSSGRNEDDDDEGACGIDYDASTGTLKLDHYVFPYKHIASTFDDFNAGSRVDKVALGNEILSEWLSYRGFRKHEGKKLLEEIKESALCLVKAWIDKQTTIFAHNTSIKLHDKSIGSTEGALMVEKLNMDKAYYYCKSIDLESQYKFGSDEDFAFMKCRTDAQISKILARLREYKEKVKEICVLDHCKVLLVPLLKLYVQNNGRR